MIFILLLFTAFALCILSDKASIVSEATRTTAPRNAPRSLIIVLAAASRFLPPLPSSSIDASAEAAEAKQKCIAVLYKDNKFCDEKAFFLK